MSAYNCDKKLNFNIKKVDLEILPFLLPNVNFSKFYQFKFALSVSLLLEIPTDWDMEELAKEFVSVLSNPESGGAVGGSGGVNFQPGIRVEIVSAKGLALPLDSREALQSLEVSALYESKHARSEPVLCTSTDPIINFSSEFSLDSRSALLTEDSLIMVYLSIAPTRSTDQVKCGVNSRCRTLISCAAVDPRLVCVYGGDYVSVELIACENDGISQIENGEGGAGSLFMRLTFINEEGKDAKFNESSNSALSSSSRPNGHSDEIDWSHEKIEQVMDQYQERISKAHQDNFQLARSWFSRARREFPFLEDRKIKLVAEDECGRHRFVCGFVSPNVQTPRSVDGPRFGARFVSLVPFKRDVSLSGERVSTWHSAQCTAIRLQGDVEDHALLLCSILLGWGMDAWVTYGTIYDAAVSSTAANSSDSKKGQTHFR